MENAIEVKLKNEIRKSILLQLYQEGLISQKQYDTLIK